MTAGSSSSSVSAELKIYQAFIFSGPILLTFLVLVLFYLLYLRRQSVDWSSLRNRVRSSSQRHDAPTSTAPSNTVGLKKELREMLPIIVYKESFSVKDAQCSVCLCDYLADDRLQQIPGCGHIFHMICIDHWLSTHTTCPLCRLSLIASAANTSFSDHHSRGEEDMNDGGDGRSVIVQNPIEFSLRNRQSCVL